MVASVSQAPVAFHEPTKVFLMTAQTPGRARHAAQPLGRRDGDDTEEKLRRTGQKAQRPAGLDGPDASVIGDTFKKK